MPAWRARAHHLTCSRAFLAKASAAILGVSALIAILLHVSRQHEDEAPPDLAPQDGAGPFLPVLREGPKRLTAATEPAPSRLIAWIRQSASQWAKADPEERGGFDAAALRLDSVELHPLIARHTTSEAQGEAVASYVRFRFLPDGDARRSAMHALEEIARESTPPLANEMLGDALFISGRSEEALRAYLRDAGVPEAKHARMRAFE